MSFRILVCTFVASAALLAAACASGGAGQSIEEAARAACEDQGIAEGPAMSACVAEMEDAIQRAREQDLTARRQPAKQAQRPPR